MSDPAILQCLQRGDPRAADDLLPLVYDELRRLAACRLARESGEHTLNPTSLVHEAWLRIRGGNERAWNGPRHFIATAAQTMRRIMVDRARRRHAAKRNGNLVAAEFVDSEIAAPGPDTWSLALHEALENFHAVHPRKAELVRLRYFVGLSFEEAADLLGIAVPTAKQWWAYSRSWLRVEIAESAESAPRKTTSLVAG